MDMYQVIRELPGERFITNIPAKLFDYGELVECRMPNGSVEWMMHVAHTFKLVIVCR